MELLHHSIEILIQRHNVKEPLPGKKYETAATNLIMNDRNFGEISGFDFVLISLLTYNWLRCPFLQILSFM